MTLSLIRIPISLLATVLLALSVGKGWAQSSAVEDGGLIDLSFQRDLQFFAGQIAEPGSKPTFSFDQVSDDELPGDNIERPQENLSSALSEYAAATEAEVLIAQVDTSVNDSTDQFQINSVGNNQEDVITLNFQGADINALISLVSQVTGKSFIVDPRVKGKVTLVSGAGLPADKLYDVFLSVLDVSNFAIVPSGAVDKILPKNLIKQYPTPNRKIPGNNDEQITHIVTLEHASVNELLPILRPLLPPTDHVAPHAGSNTLILTGTSANISRTLGLIRRLDKEQRGVEIRVIYLKYADATKLSQIISQTLSAINADNARTGQPPASVSVQVG